MNWSKKRCVILDMDGTVYVGNNPIREAVKCIQDHWNHADFYFLSNNTSKSLDSYIKKLNRMGIAARREQFLSPVTPLVNFLRQNNIKKAFIVGNSDFKAELAQRMSELDQTDREAQAVILAYDTDLTYAKISRAALLLQNPETLYLATHPDLVCPSPEGPLPDAGSFMEMFFTATGRRPQRIFGKPDPAVLSPLMAKYAKEDMIMVGDRLSTDKKLAENAGIDFALVLSGEATREDVEKESRQPAVILENLGCSIWN